MTPEQKAVLEDLMGTASLAATMLEGIGRAGFNDSKAARKGLMATAEELRVASWKAYDLLHPDSPFKTEADRGDA